MAKYKVKDGFVVRKTHYVMPGNKPLSKQRNHPAVKTAKGWFRLNHGYDAFNAARRKLKEIMDRGRIDTQHWTKMEIEG